MWNFSTFQSRFNKFFYSSITCLSMILGWWESQTSLLLDCSLSRFSVDETETVLEQNAVCFGTHTAHTHSRTCNPSCVCQIEKVRWIWEYERIWEREREWDEYVSLHVWVAMTKIEKHLPHCVSVSQFEALDFTHAAHLISHMPKKTNTLQPVINIYLQ